LALPYILYHPACFHAQQCAERSIKAVLTHQGTVPPRTDVISDLLHLLPTEFLSDLRSQLNHLDHCYQLTHYFDAMIEGEITETDAAEAIAVARSVLEQAGQRCATPLPTHSASADREAEQEGINETNDRP
jgi:HEPN domain-containing protein